MSNMTMDFNPPTPPKPVQVFTIIRLTNHAPVRVLLDEWKALAEGRWNNGDPESPYYQEIGIRALYLREPWKIPVRTVGDGETIVHAWACLDDGEYDRRTERVHADRLLTAMETADRGSCDRHILAVADELRERIKDEGLRRSVTEAVDLRDESACRPRSRTFDLGDDADRALRDGERRPPKARFELGLSVCAKLRGTAAPISGAASTFHDWS